jgi:hypothetical protein
MQGRNKHSKILANLLHSNRLASFSNSCRKYNAKGARADDLAWAVKVQRRNSIIQQTDLFIYERYRSISLSGPSSSCTSSATHRKRKQRVRGFEVFRNLKMIQRLITRNELLCCSLKYLLKAVATQLIQNKSWCSPPTFEFLLPTSAAEGSCTALGHTALLYCATRAASLAGVGRRRAGGHEYR